MNFNPRTPVGCDGLRTLTRRDGVRFQSTHPSGVRHRSSSTAQFGSIISIHAPQWGATNAFNMQQYTVGISIHAPQWGATALSGRRGYCVRDFNPRTPVGCDSVFTVSLRRSMEFQSTHPSGVRRCWSMPSVPHWMLFQSTHPSGVRRRLADIDKAYDVFQSTHPSGVRLRFLPPP